MIFVGAKFTTAAANSAVVLADGKTSFLQGSPLWDEMIEEGITPADYAAPPATWDSVRGERNQLLKDTDWQASSDRTMSDAETAYRQALRDLPSTNSDPASLVWPTAPGV
tara:strand:- start:1704 stop:2033 length:330 start_codon:yes stop_codon:yes gene_type:complete